VVDVRADLLRNPYPCETNPCRQRRRQKSATNLGVDAVNTYRLVPNSDFVRSRMLDRLRDSFENFRLTGFLDDETSIRRAHTETPGKKGARY
jgi:hypothetical protein